MDSPMAPAERFDLLLTEVRLIRAELNQHIKDETHDFQDIRDKINDLHTRSEVNKGKIAMMVTLLSSGVAAAVGFIGKAF